MIICLTHKALCINSMLYAFVYKKHNNHFSFRSKIIVMLFLNEFTKINNIIVNKFFYSFFLWNFAPVLKDNSLNYKININ